LAGSEKIAWKKLIVNLMRFRIKLEKLRPLKELRLEVEMAN